MKNLYEPLFSMGVVRRLTGLTERQIRYWEAQRVISPARTPGNHRLYSQADINDLVWAARLRSRGYRLSEILDLRTEGNGLSHPSHESDAHFRFQKPKPGAATSSPGHRADPPLTRDRVRLLEEIDRRRTEILGERREKGNG